MTVRARSNADPNFSASVAVMLTSAVTVDLNPATSSVAIEESQSLTVQVNGTTNQMVSWLVNGIAGGNAIVGQICAAGLNPCQPVSTATGAGSVDYVAPAGMPSPESDDQYGNKPGGHLQRAVRQASHLFRTWW